MIVARVSYCCQVTVFTCRVFQVDQWNVPISARVSCSWTSVSPLSHDNHHVSLFIQNCRPTRSSSDGSTIGLECEDGAGEKRLEMGTILICVFVS